MSGVCTVHNQYYKGDKCPACNAKDLSDARKWEREKKRGGKPSTYDRFKKYREKNKVRENLKSRLQVWWRKKIMELYTRLGVAKRCWICDKPFPVKSSHVMSSPHISHYYAKGSLYRLWCDPVNSGVLCYNHNVNKPETVVEMEPMMVKVWGQEAVDAMKKRAEEHSYNIKIGKDRRYPTNEWFLYQIEEVKKLQL